MQLILISFNIQKHFPNFWPLCYSWSLTHHNLIDHGKAAGTIAGQLFKEPGTQLVLRTFMQVVPLPEIFHKYVRILFQGTINFHDDDKSVYTTCRQHGHTAWMCTSELLIPIKSHGNKQSFSNPKQILLMIRNVQHVESQQAA